jgi:hypothetical protein
MARLGSSAVELILVLIGVFLAIAAYSRKPVMLRLATLGTFRIDPDHPGETARLVLFTVGVTVIVLGVLLLFVDRLSDLGLISSSH